MLKLLTLSSVFFCSLLCAQELVIENAYIPQPPPGSPASAYLLLKNSGPLKTLVDVDSAQAGMAMIHQTVVVDGVAKMKHVEAIDIPPNGQVQFAPGGTHIMLMRLSSPLQVGDEVSITLIFANKQKQEIRVPVKARQ